MSTLNTTAAQAFDPGLPGADAFSPLPPPVESTIEVRQKTARGAHLLDPGMSLTLRPMRYPEFFDRYKDAIKNTWTVEEVDFSSDTADLNQKMGPEERHLIKRLVAFFATGDSIVANNLVLNLYKHINAPEARLYLSRQLYEEAQHVEFYLTLLDTYIPDTSEREEAFRAIETIPSIRQKADFCFKYIESIDKIDELRTPRHRRTFLLNMMCFAACIEGLFFFAAFAYVYFLRSRGLLLGLAGGTNWVFRDESCHMDFAFSVVDTIREEEPELFDDELNEEIYQMIHEAVEAETQFAKDLLDGGVAGLTSAQMRQYLEYVADQRLDRLGLAPRYNTTNPLSFMELQDVQEVTNFFERRVSAYQVGVTGEVEFDLEF
jgi:ribonucleoside-diphosphate reductase beta chain